jgi:hypothetical protein
MQWDSQESLATIDLSNASDTISSKVVETVLPPDWYEALNLTRSHYGSLDSGAVIRYQKFSTMGNGYTFELESLIFWAICSAVVDILELGDTRIGVYGDDLIVSSNAFELLEYTLMDFGFTLNPKKSYSTGPFRESCGKHWFKGRDVSPFYIRKGVETVVDELLVVNNVRRWMTRLYNGFIPPKAWLVYVEIRDTLLPAWVVKECKIPDGYGDLGVVSSFEEACPQRHVDAQGHPDGLEGWSCDTLRIKPTPLHIKKRYRVTGSPLMTKSLSSLERLHSRSHTEISLMPLPWLEVYSACMQAGEAPSDEIPYSSKKLRLTLSKLSVHVWSDTGGPF